LFINICLSKLTSNTLTGQQSLNVSKFDFEKWMTKANNFLKKYNYTNCQVNINGSVPYSEIMSTKLAMISALYESFDLEDDCIANLKSIPNEIKDLYCENHYSQAVFDAFKYVEVQVKTKSGYNNLYGTDLMRKAFASEDKNKNKPAGPLTNQSLPIAEQQSL